MFNSLDLNPVDYNIWGCLPDVDDIVSNTSQLQECSVFWDTVYIVRRDTTLCDIAEELTTKHDVESYTLKRSDKHTGRVVALQILLQRKDASQLNANYVKSHHFGQYRTVERSHTYHTKRAPISNFTV